MCGWGDGLGSREGGVKKNRKVVGDACHEEEKVVEKPRSSCWLLQAAAAFVKKKKMTASDFDRYDSYVGEIRNWVVWRCVWALAVG